MSTRLTPPCQVNFPGVNIFLEGGQKPCFRVRYCAGRTGKHRRMTFILSDPCLTEDARGSTHPENLANKPACCEPFVSLVLPGYGTYLDVVTLATVMDEFVKAQFVDLVSLFVPPQRTVRLHVGKINL